MNFNNNTEYYNILKVSKNATIPEIKKAYYKLALTHHPDKGGNADQFKKITEAFEVLSNEDKKKLYDNGGIPAVSFGNKDIFNNIFKNNKSIQVKVKDVVYNLNLTLEDIYSGINKILEIKKKCVIQDSVKICDICKGKGSIKNVNKLSILNNEIKCNKCNGIKYTYETKQIVENLEVNIEKGVKDKTKIILKNKGDEIPHGEAGNINIIINEIPHPKFYRKGLDLYYKCDISLLESLCGFELDFEHLDKRKFIIKNQVGEITTYSKNIKLENWEKYYDYSINLDPFAKSDVTDIEKIKNSIEHGKLKDKKISAFKIDNNKTYYYKQDKKDFLENMEEKDDCKLFIKNNENKKFKCIENEGMININNEKGNLYFVFNIIFPEFISKDLKNYLLNSELNLQKKECKFKNIKNTEITYLQNKIPTIFSEKHDEDKNTNNCVQQ